MSGHVKVVRIRRADAWGWWVIAHTYAGDVATHWRPTESMALSLKARIYDRDDRALARQADRINKEHTK